jgi:hypothetical protein
VEKSGVERRHDVADDAVQPHTPDGLLSLGVQFVLNSCSLLIHTLHTTTTISIIIIIIQLSTYYYSLWGIIYF